MSELQLDVHGIIVTLSGDPEALAALAVHFAAFVRQPPGDAAVVRIELRRATPDPGLLGRRRASQVVERGLVYNDGSVTMVDHHGYASTRFDFAAETGVVTAANLDDLVELGYLMVHARLGPLLEARGLVRAHAVGICCNGRTALVFMPSGGGKSRLALALLRHPEVRLLGDDVVLLDRRGNALPFPMPIGVTAPAVAAQLGSTQPFPRRQHGLKHILPLEHIRDRIAGPSNPVQLLVVAYRVNRGPSRIAPASGREVIGTLWRDVVVGLGLPQVIELVARNGVNDLWRQVPAVTRRTAAVSTVLARARRASLEIYDPDDAAAVLLEELAR